MTIAHFYILLRVKEITVRIIDEKFKFLFKVEFAVEDLCRFVSF